MPVYFVVDDQSPELVYLCPITKETVSGAYFNKTWTTVASDQCRDGWFQYSFFGTSVEVIAFSSTSQNHSVKIDDLPWISQSTRGNFQSSSLPDARHTISYASGELTNPTLDYLVLEAGSSTPLQDRTIIVDDADPALLFNGNWSTTIPSPTANDLSTAAFRDTTHWSTTVGDSFQYTFSGSYVALFGSFANISMGHNFSATYSIDGIPTVASIPNGTLDGLPLACLFASDTLPAGNHTISVSITQISSPLAVGFDFLTFNSSSSSLEQMPGYMSSSLSHKKRPGAIAGGVIGGTVLLLAIISIVLLWRRRVRRKQNAQRWSEIN